MKLEIIKKVLGIVILVISVFYGVYAIAFGGIISGLISTVINSYPNLMLLNYSYKEQLKDIMPSLLLSFVMGAIYLLHSVYWFFGGANINTSVECWNDFLRGNGADI